MINPASIRGSLSNLRKSTLETVNPSSLPAIGK